MRHACTLEFPEVESDAIDNLCGSMGLMAEDLADGLSDATCPDCLRALAEWGQRQGQAACGLAFDLGRLWWLAACAVTVVDDWLGMASTRSAAEDTLWRLKRALEAPDIGSAYIRRALGWRGEAFRSEEQAGFRSGLDGQLRRILPAQKPWEPGAGLTLAEEVERLRYERDELRERLEAHEFVMGPLITAAHRGRYELTPEVRAALERLR